MSNYMTISDCNQSKYRETEKEVVVQYKSVYLRPFIYIYGLT